ncbi:MAG: protein kinase [Vicinamibacteria bacterium]
MLKPGTRIGPYEVVGSLGAGGMGEVHRARDDRLGREVALKTLPEGGAHWPDRLTRLRREARVLASLNHPGIATLYGFEDYDGRAVLVMELVAGETLASRLRRGPLPLGEALEVARQVASALAAAHEKGVLHRDVKPSNIQLVSAGRVKLLDFGLASRLGLDSCVTTESVSVSRTGAVLGTGPYMSPEQERGEELDARTDAWAFGCVLYEILAGNRAFPGGTYAEAAAAVLVLEPDWTALPESTPPALARLLRRCLRKDRNERLHDLADAARELKELQQTLSSEVASEAFVEGRPRVAVRRTPGGSWIAAAAIVLVASAGIVVLARQRGAAPPTDARLPRLQAVLPRDVELPRLGGAQVPFAVSPDGQQIAFVGVGVGAGWCQLYVRDRREVHARPVPGTDGASNPFFSPDGRRIAFAAGRKLKKVDLDTGAVVTLADVQQFRGGSWGEDGMIVFNRGHGGLVRVAESGGETQEVTRTEPVQPLATHRWPVLVPRSRLALFDITGQNYPHAVAIVDLGTGRIRVLAEQASSPRWSPTGHLLFARQGILYAAPLDTKRLVLTSAPVPVVEGVAMWDSPGGTGSGAGNAYYDVARDGTLVYSPREARLPRRTLLWVDRQGRRTPLSRQQGPWLWPHLSPDGRRLAATAFQNVDASEVLLLDLERDAWTKLLLQAPGGLLPEVVSLTSWMPDARRLLVTARWQGRDQLLLVSDDGQQAPVAVFPGGDLADPSPDGRTALARVQTSPGQWDIWQLALAGQPQARAWLATPAFEADPRFAPDGRWVAYRSDESGAFQVYARPYPGPGAAHLVSTQGGYVPRWSRDGRELYFTDGRAMYSVVVRTAAAFSSQPPRKLFDLPSDVPWGLDFYDVTPDGQRFVMVQRDPIELQAPGLVVVPNWTAELRARLARASTDAS